MTRKQAHSFLYTIFPLFYPPLFCGWWSKSTIFLYPLSYSSAPPWVVSKDFARVVLCLRHGFAYVVFLWSVEEERANRCFSIESAICYIPTCQSQYSCLDSKWCSRRGGVRRPFLLSLRFVRHSACQSLYCCIEREKFYTCTMRMLF